MLFAVVESNPCSVKKADVDTHPYGKEGQNLGVSDSRIEEEEITLPRFKETSLASTHYISGKLKSELCKENH